MNQNNDTALPETPAQIRARLFISYKMAQAELGRAIDALLSMNPLNTHDEKVESARMYAKSASDVILGEYFDLENTERDKSNG